MNFDFLSRTGLLVSNEKLNVLRNSHVAIFGLGGIGSCAAEMLCRGGIGKLTIIDGDIVVLSNLNRQLHSLRSNLNYEKTIVLQDRLLSINPNLEVHRIQRYLKYRQDFTQIFENNTFDFVLDCIDTLTSKCILIETAYSKKIPIVVSFGAGGRLDPTQIQIADISKTKNCRLAYYVRKKLHKVGIYNGIQTVFSTEIPRKECLTLEEPVQGKKSTIGTISYMPNLFGCFAASIVIRTLLE
jgi:tRNA A37 threonylcarbamoyladenosine dehydratase